MCSTRERKWSWAGQRSFPKEAFLSLEKRVGEKSLLVIHLFTHSSNSFNKYLLSTSALGIVNIAVNKIERVPVLLQCIIHISKLLNL